MGDPLSRYLLYLRLLNLLNIFIGKCIVYQLYNKTTITVGEMNRIYNFSLVRPASWVNWFVYLLLQRSNLHRQSRNQYFLFRVGLEKAHNVHLCK